MKTKSLVTVTRTDNALRIVVTDEAARVLNASGTPTHTPDMRKQVVRNIANTLGWALQTDDGLGLDPIYIVTARGLSNRGFRASAMLAKDATDVG